VEDVVLIAMEPDRWARWGSSPRFSNPNVARSLRNSGNNARSHPQVRHGGGVSVRGSTRTQTLRHPSLDGTVRLLSA